MSSLSITALTGDQIQVDAQAVADLQTAVRGPLVTADSPDYDEVRQIWNGMHNKRPALIVRCSGVADVIEAVNFARTHGLLTAVRGGGHNVAGTGSCEGGLMIDLSLMRGVRVDREKCTVHAQGGATWGDVDRETQVFGLATPGGVVSTTGIAGLTLGGGLGWLRRKHGLSIDNLVSVDIVTADGECRTASESQHSDLFWAIRGGGGNFGVVTSFEYRLHPIGPLVTLCAPWYPVEMAKEVMTGWRDFMATAPEEIASNFLFWTVPPIPDFPAEAHGRRVVIPTAVHIGPLEEGARQLQPLRELGTPLIDLSGSVPWTVLQGMFDPFFPAKEQLYYFKSRYLSNLDEATINALIPRASHPPQPMVLVVLWHYGGAMSQVGATATAFTGRDAPYLLSVDAMWRDPQDSEEVIAYAQDFLAAMEAYSPGGLYVNFAGLGEEGERLVQSAYGANYTQLSTLKLKYDPTNLFRLN
ncbi:MAG: FAD-binding oxidoreductase, partial [Caldilineaceae bacterium]